MSAAGPDGRLLTFFVGEEQFATPAADVLEVFRHPPVTRVPHGPPSLLGITGLRGVPTPVVSLAKLLGKPPSAGAAVRLLLLNGDPQLGLVVDRVGALVAAPASAQQGRVRLYQIDDKAARLLDLDELLQREFAARARPAPHRPGADERRKAGRSESKVEAEVRLLSFSVAGQAYALLLEEVAEALDMPAQLASIAQSDDAALGVVDWRDGLLPIVSLRTLLGLPPQAAPGGRVVVARLGDAVVGLAVDRLQAILRVPEDTIDAAPAVLNRGAGEAQVQAVCRLGGGAGLVAILSSRRLFSDDKVARIVKDAQSGSGAMEDGAEAAGARERFLLFRLGDEEYGLPLAAVDEIVRLPEHLTRAPKAPPFIEGVANLRGRIVPIIDQRRRFAGQAETTREAKARPRVIVTQVEGRPAGFIVDAVSEIIALAPDQIGPTPELTADASRLFTQVASLDGGARLILLIEPRELLDRVEQDLLAALEASAAAAET